MEGCLAAKVLRIRFHVATPGHEKPWCWAGGMITSGWSHKQPVTLWISKGLPSQVVDIAYVAARPIHDWFPAKGNWATAEMRKLDGTRLKVAMIFVTRWIYRKDGLIGSLVHGVSEHSPTLCLCSCLQMIAQKMFRSAILFYPSLWWFTFLIYIYTYCSLSVNSWVRRSIVQNFETNFGAHNIFRSIQKNVNR